jgi:hypothetical protein
MLSECLAGWHKKMGIKTLHRERGRIWARYRFWCANCGWERFDCHEVFETKPEWKEEG